jgi:hypothetical protein
MKFRSVCKSILIPLLLPYSLFLGCSAIGAAVGGAVHPAREGRITSTLGLDSIAVGTAIRLVRFDHISLEGTYGGLAMYPGRLYALRYDTLVARSAYRGFVPKLNQKIALRSAGISEDGFFKGIERGALLFQPASEPDTVSVSLEDVDWLMASDSSRLEGKTIRKLVRQGSIPGREIILLQTDNRGEHVPYESIEMVEVVRTGSGALTGFLVGAALDVVAAIIVIGAEQQSESDCNRSTSGCNGNQTCTAANR